MGWSVNLNGLKKYTYEEKVPYFLIVLLRLLVFVLKKSLHRLIPLLPGSGAVLTMGLVG